MEPMAIVNLAKRLVLLGLVATSVASKQRPLQSHKDKAFHHGNPLTDEFGRYVTDLMDEWKVPGLSVAVIDGEDVYSQGYGFARLPDTPVTPDTLFLGGSTTKAHLAAALAHLISSGDYAAAFPQGWSTPISSIIRDDFVLQDEWATAHITLEDAVSHRTGMPRHDIAWAGTSEPNDTSNPHKTNKATVRNLRNLPPTAEPRVVFQYCNLMFTVLSHVVETVTASWLGDVLRSVIWQPLDMKSTFLSYSEARKSENEIATGYFWDEDAEQYVAVEEDPVQFSSGAGAIITNAVDYSKWVRCLLYETEPFSAATHREIKTARMLAIPNPSPGWGVSSYGLGWQVTTFHGAAVYQHNGGTQNFGTNVFWMPEIKFGVVAFANTAGTGNIIEEILTQKLVEDRLGIPPEDRPDNGSHEQRRQIEQAKRDFDNATNILYPGHATDSPSSKVDYELLAGTYRDAGYGTYSFKVEKLPITGFKGSQGQQRLVALRDDLLIPMRLVLQHVVGDYWVAYLLPVLGSSMTRTFYAVKFIIGVDGKPAAFELTWREATDRLSATKTRFERVH
ncbi:hypothetical protein NLG97_g7678 [Lecanicillium saksenae]|uniref:Uncharacterized protein n=1 Tax=Lecanicillium saksenae TaxID=468837 RepID=A0ACC1QNF7_9HYPO|nr:hypothetical protein NLG97_g7678 [Lecanicillium saksenae]